MSHKHYYEFNVFNAYIVHPLSKTCVAGIIESLMCLMYTWYTLSLSLSLSLQKHRKTGISRHSIEVKSQKSQVLKSQKSLALSSPKYQSVFGIGGNWTPGLLYNHQKFYQLN